MSETWYQNRDKRTDSCNHVNPGYKKASVQVFVTEPIEDYRVQLLTYFSVVMLAKWCRNIIFTAEPAACVLDYQGSFAEYIKQQTKAIDPDCHFEFQPKNTITGDIRLYIGAATIEENANYVSINGAGWTSVCAFNRSSSLKEQSTSFDVLGCSFAACLGNAALFRYLTGQPELPNTKWYSLFQNEVSDFPIDIPTIVNEVSELDLGRIHLIGCGAIGSSFAFLMPYLQLKARTLLIDPDFVEDHNTSSSLMFTFKDAADKKEKAVLCSDYLNARGIEGLAFQDDYNKYQYSYEAASLNSPDLILCFANENNIWSTIQQQYPPLCFHATTSKSWGVHIGRHIPLKENCILCTFKDFIDTKYIPICGLVDLPETTQSQSTKDPGHTAILPFLAPAAAIVTLSELIKLVWGQKNKENTTIFNMATSAGQFVSDYEPFGKCFVCSTQHQLYPQLGQFSKYWFLSEIK